jgi:hypothetical protein
VALPVRPSGSDICGPIHDRAASPDVLHLGKADRFAPQLRDDLVLPLKPLTHHDVTRGLSQPALYGVRLEVQLADVPRRISLRSSAP